MDKNTPPLAAKPLALALVLGFGLVGCAGDGTTQTNHLSGLTQLTSSLAKAMLNNQLGPLNISMSDSVRNMLAGMVMYLDAQDQQALSNATKESLESGEEVSWKSAKGDSSGSVKTVSSTTHTQQAKVSRAPSIARADNLSVLNQPWQALKSANLRAAPDTSSAKVGGFAAGQSFTALGKTANNWLAVGRQGVLVGYLYAPLAAPMTEKRASEATDLDNLSAASASKQGFDLDAIAPAKAVTEEVPVQTTCRTLNYEVKAGEHEDSQTVNACQSVDGSWELS